MNITPPKPDPEPKLPEPDPDPAEDVPNQIPDPRNPGPDVIGPPGPIPAPSLSYTASSQSPREHPIPCRI